MKNLSDIREDFFKGVYDNRLAKNRGSLITDNYVYDENQSVKWNRDKVNVANVKVMELRAIYNDETVRLGKLMYDDIIGALMQESDDMTEAQAKILYDFAHEYLAYDDGIFDSLERILIFLKQFNGAQE